MKCVCPKTDKECQSVVCNFRGCKWVRDDARRIIEAMTTDELIQHIIEPAKRRERKEREDA